ncbi:unnamed protein product [Fusarium langsethiae]|nr:unnamed protein product [Fusarium langsethiae]
MYHQPISPLLDANRYCLDSSTINPSNTESLRPRPEELTQSYFIEQCGAGTGSCSSKMASAFPVSLLSPFVIDTEYTPFLNDITPISIRQDSLGWEINHMPENSGTRNNSISSYAPSTTPNLCEYVPNTNFQIPFMLSTQSFSGSDSAEPLSTLSCDNDGLNSFSPKRHVPDDWKSFDSDH